MHTKLTLRLDERLVRRAKAYARRTGKSVSQIVAEYFLLLLGREDQEGEQLPPTVRQLKGSLRGKRVDRRDYYEYLGKKHQ
jgi:hypothetical protein